MKISIIVPSRGRPDKLERLIDSALETMRSKNLEVMAYIDNNDPELEKYKALEAKQPKLRLIVDKESTVVWANNVLCENSTGDCVMPMGDDAVFSTYTWDMCIEDTAKQYPNGLWMAGFMDGREGWSHIAFDRHWRKALGWWWPPIFNHFGVDEWITNLARHPEIDRYDRHEDVLIHHQKCDGGSFPIDATFKRIRNNTNLTRDKWLLENMQRYWQKDFETLFSYKVQLDRSNSERVKEYVRMHE